MSKKYLTRVGLLAVALVLTGVVGVQAVLATATTVIVAGDTAAAENQPGWLFNRDASTSTPFEFNFERASIGVGSVYVGPIGATTPADKFIAENFLNAPVADVGGISYDFLIGGGGDAGDAVHFYMNVYTNFGESDDFKFYDCRYNIVPAAGSTAAFTTVTFDPTLAYPVTTHSSSPNSCPAVPADMDDFGPGSNIRVFALNVGDTSVNDAGLDGHLDKVVVDLAGNITTYDFDPVPLTKDDCKNSEWKRFGFKNQGQCILFVETGQDTR